jgi:hypothetical protein
MADAPAARVSGPCQLHRPEHLPPVGQHARDDHGDLPAHGAVPGRIRQLSDPADGRGPRHGVSLREHGQLLDVPAGCAAARRELLRARGPERRRLDAVPAAGRSWTARRARTWASSCCSFRWRSSSSASPWAA